MSNLNTLNGSGHVVTGQWADVTVGDYTMQQAFVKGADGIVYLAIRNQDGEFIADVPTGYTAA